ncbi:MAG: outer membrane protein assembly factor BamD [Candidatus Omnitrophica bacterium]|nr:outer membrane protein assembly factor BamD [Candidatus Omnitrophota bacterium]MDD5352006.1 outer membrane protein assembly factor BamD [Candidatus Omnitrophota bacterium]MDD5551060.1 outer membrane protein assembly factor BamD [Candidatus Omnitrophota bacterium]
MKKHIFKIMVLFLCLSFSSCATFSESADYYRRARYLARKNNCDKAFMQLKELLSNEPNSKYAPAASFSVGEYYLDKEDYPDALVAFQEYIKYYPDDPAVIFAELIIYKIGSQIKKNKEVSSQEQYLFETIRQKILSKPLFLFVFNDNIDRISYSSLFGNSYIVFYSKNKIIAIRNGKVFVELIR